MSNFTIDSIVPSQSPIITEFKTAICDSFFELPRAERWRVSAWHVAGALLLAAAVGLAVHCWHCRAAARARHARREEEEAAAAAAQEQEAATATAQAHAHAAAQEAATAHSRVAELELHLAASQARAAALQRDLARLQAWAERMEKRFGLLQETREVEAELVRTTRALCDKANDEVNRLRHLLAEKDGPSAAMAPLQGARPGSSQTSAQAETSERGGRTTASALPAGERPAAEADAPEESEYFSSTSYT